MMKNKVLLGKHFKGHCKIIFGRNICCEISYLIIENHGNGVKLCQRTQNKNTNRRFFKSHINHNAAIITGQQWLCSSIKSVSAMDSHQSVTVKTKKNHQTSFWSDSFISCEGSPIASCLFVMIKVGMCGA